MDASSAYELSGCRRPLDARGERASVPQLRDGANLFWRFIQIPAVLAPDGAQHLFDRPLRADARMFHRANLFFTAVCDE